MVTIANYVQRTSAEGESFNALIIQGGVEMVQSKETGNYYATAKITSITSTFDEETCKTIIGTQIPGSIKKVDCEAYEYTIKETGEIITLKLCLLISIQFPNFTISEKRTDYAKPDYQIGLQNRAFPCLFSKPHSLRDAGKNSRCPRREEI